jgi:hypothetical protein
LLTVLAFGVYLSSFIKDLICSPRPFAPPVTRFSMQQSILQVIYLKSVKIYSYRFAPSRVRFSFNTFDKQCFHRAFFLFNHSSPRVPAWSRLVFCGRILDAQKRDDG